jgi:coenzyme F420-reducing hydrogenase alpha subunit
VYAALRPPKDYGYYFGEEFAVLSNGMRQTVAAAEYRSLTNERAAPHSHAKHSSFNGRPFMVGSLARLAANSDMLAGRAAEVIRKLGLTLPSDNPMDNNKAQAVELIFDVEYALGTVERLLSEGLKEEPRVRVRPRAGAGIAVTEAPRGSLIHSYTYDEEGRITAADVITPTALNAASIENHIRHVVEQSAEKEVPALTRKIEMTVRAYDPCISCSVHLIRTRHAA